MGLPEGEDPPDEPDDAPLSASVTEGIVPLGHDRGVYYYLSRATGQVEVISAAGHTRSMLTHLASELYYWQRGRFAGAKGKVDWDAAADHLRGQCRDVGIYDHDRLRGRGAWLDGTHSVLHLGDRLLVDGQQSSLTIPGSHYVYEHAKRMHVDITPALSSARAKRLMDLCVALPWTSPQHMGRLLAGWCVIAPVCGAMTWRPHLWITSESGNGKSYVLDNIVKPIVGSVALQVQSKTTEAGIRQTLGCDARPVIFDEAETQNERDRDRIQLVLDLARQASSEAGAAIIKGSAVGKAMQFRIRSCFVFSSVNLGMSQAADQSRTVELSLCLHPDPKSRAAAFAKLQKLHSEVMTADFASGLLARTLELLPAIRQNSVLFAEAIARSGQSRRSGDTFGVLLAGAWSLRSPSVVTPEQADKFVGETDWVQAAVKTSNEEPEWQRAITTLLQHRERVTNANGRSEDVPIGELIESVVNGSSDPGGVRPLDAAFALKRMGFKVSADNKTLYVANRCAIAVKAFEKTPWALSWLATITRAPGAARDVVNLRLPVQTKCLGIPISVIQE